MLVSNQSLTPHAPSEDTGRSTAREDLLSALAKYAPYMDSEEQLQELLQAATRPEVVEAVKRWALGPLFEHASSNCEGRS